MNLIDAIKSGRPYKLVGSSYWLGPGKSGHMFNCTDVLADYEIQEPSVTITRAQFWEAADAGIYLWNHNEAAALGSVMSLIARNLGLEEK